VDGDDFSSLRDKKKGFGRSSLLQCDAGTSRSSSWQWILQKISKDFRGGRRYCQMYGRMIGDRHKFERKWDSLMVVGFLRDPLTMTKRF
jgi:hypothetical protein